MIDASSVIGVYVMFVLRCMWSVLQKPAPIPDLQALHNGDGVCRFLRGNMCSIYETRPLICRVDESYEAFFKEQMSYEAYIQLNYACCKLLKSEAEG